MTADRCRVCDEEDEWLDDDDLCGECRIEADDEYEHELEIRSDYYARLL